MKILYIVMGDLSRVDSGSGLRPKCMYDAFLERGHTLYVLSGYQGRHEGNKRRAEVEKAKQWVEENRPDLCYIESSTYPMIHRCDYDMIRYLAKKKIPTSYFYRDIYRVIPGLVTKKRKDLTGRLKDLYLDLMQKYTDHILHKVDIVYFPSQRFTNYFHYKRMELLPPAGQWKDIPSHPATKTCIYVGGVSEFYGYPLMMEAFRILNADTIRYKLILVCREAEYKTIAAGQELPQWLEVHHASGKALEPLYARADAGLLALGYNEYSHLCIGIKLFQYISYGLPVVSTNVETMGKIIRENHFGELAEPDPQSYADAIRRLLDDDEKRADYRRRMGQALREKHLWVHRVDRIVEDLVTDR